MPMPRLHSDDRAMILPLLLLILVSVVMPLTYAWRLWRLDQASRAGWLLLAGEATFIVLLVLLVSRWDLVGYFTPPLLAAIFLLSLAASWRRHATRPWLSGNRRSVWRSRPVTLLATMIIAAAYVHVGMGMLAPAGARDLAFPLRGGAFAVGQGGSSRLLNHHHGHPEQRYALDIVAIDRLGFRAAGLLPEDLGRYRIFDAKVVSPCAGSVRFARDGLADLVPPNVDAQHPAGNHVVIDCEGMDILLAHLRNGSVAVQAGDRLGVGDAVGRVGNSGNTTEPHLHIHAVDPESRRGVAITFDSRSAARNSLFRR